MDKYEKRGYLIQDFQLFHLTDQGDRDIPYHYHDFDKIFIFIQGKVTYRIEGQSYYLQPWDILLVNHYELHRPEIQPSQPYERIIFYLSPGFLDRFSGPDWDLSTCFQRSSSQGSRLLRLPSMEKTHLFQIISSLEQACSSDAYAGQLHRQVLFLEFMIHLNRAVLQNQVEYPAPAVADTRIQQAIDLINSGLTQPLSIDAIAAGCYMSRYHLMRQFKAATGCTIGKYISEKRLLLARNLLEQGASVTEACFQCGFQNYSTFSRAYRSFFHASPSDRKKTENPSAIL